MLRLSGLAALPVLVAATLPLPASAATPTGSPLALEGARLRQDGFELVLRVRTRRPWRVAALGRRPGRSLCLSLWRRGRAASSTTLCLASGPRRTARLMLVRPGRRSVVVRGADVTDRLGAVHVVRFGWEQPRLRPGRWRWRVTSTWSDECAAPRPGCLSNWPARGGAPLVLHRPRPIGCAASRPWYRTHGGTHRRRIALAFDDGPGPDTPGFLRTLKRLRVRATFFVVGRELVGHAALLRRELADGNAIGNHTLSHANVSGGGPSAAGQLAAANRAIARATGGYRPCLFRAPYGAISRPLIARARALGMTTIGWNVDPSDYLRQGAGTITARVLAQARPGSITIMHDGPRARGETLAALPTIVRALRRRGYRFETVPELLGFPTRYR